MNAKQLTISETRAISSSSHIIHDKVPEKYRSPLMPCDTKITSDLLKTWLWLTHVHYLVM